MKKLEPPYVGCYDPLNGRTEPFKLRPRGSKTYSRPVLHAWRPALSAICLGVGVLLSHSIEPGIHVEHVTLAADAPSLKFSPLDSNPHPIALMTHGVTASKETLFRLGEALAAAGFICYAVDLPGHGESPKRFSAMENSSILSDIARELGAVEVFIGHSMGAGAGAAAVRNGGMRPRLFIAAGASPDLGEHGPPLLLLAGKFEEFHPPSLLKARTDAQLVLSPKSDHALEPYDPILVNAAVEAACVAVGRTPPPPPTRWIWRLTGVLLAGLGAVSMALWLPELPRKWAVARGPLVAIIVIASVVLTTGTWLCAAPILRRIPAQILFMSISWLLLAGAARLRLPMWTFCAAATLPAFGCILAAMCAPPLTFWEARSRFFALFLSLGALLVFAATAVGWLAARRGSRRDGDIAIAIFLGYALGQWMPRLL